MYREEESNTAGPTTSGSSVTLQATGTLQQTGGISHISFKN